MSRYQELRRNAPKLQIKDGAKEVIFKTISCMCDNVHYFRFKKNNNGEFKLDCMGYSYGNFSIKAEKYMLEWNADDNAWRCIVDLINTGTSVIESVQSR
jgi:hypothetical protein